MAYTSNIPQAGDDPSDSQSEILANFQEIGTLVAVNHVAFNDGDQGKHKFMQMPEQGSAPSTAANEGALYTKEESGATQLFFRDESSGSERQITGAFTAATNGQVTIPGGLILKWGQGNFSGSSTSGSVTYSSAFPSAAYNVQATLVGGPFGTSVASTSSTTGFTIERSSGSVSGQAFHWIAIGK